MASRLTKNIKKLAALQFSEAAHLIEKEDDADDIAWATRSSMWQSRAEKASARRTKRAKPAPAITLAGHGVSLRIEGGALNIQNGFTHYPQQREIIRYFRGDVALPERIILLDGSGSISFDVLSWLAEQKVSSYSNWLERGYCLCRRRAGLFSQPLSREMAIGDTRKPSKKK